MSKFNSDKVMLRYFFIALVMIIIAFAILAKALYIMTAKKDYWMTVAERQKKDSIAVKPVRGNILSCDGQIMASSIPEYKVFMDFQAGEEPKRPVWNAIYIHMRDSVWLSKLDTICEGLHAIFPSQTARQFRTMLEEGRRRRARSWPIWKKRIDYSTFCEVKALPLFNRRGGFHYEEFNSRRRPFGSLGARTIGDLYHGKDSARFGLELSYDSILRGTNGLIHRQKILNKYMSVTEQSPIDGADIVTTIDVGIQDIAERALIDELKLIGAVEGVAIVMDVPTGDVKAMVNMSLCYDGRYREIHNTAVSNLLEPGSVFKPVSILVALDDGVVDTTLRVDTGSGVYEMHGRLMKDHNWRRGGYQVLTLPQTLMVSSNVGVSRIIDEHYGKDPAKFVKGVYRTGIASNLHIPLVGATAPRIRMPKKNKRGQWLNWSATALPWMSIGYETQIPPISTLAFYNGIANNGRMMQPRFVERVEKDGQIIAEYPTVVVREHMAGEKAVKKMQTILEEVVSRGLGRKAGSKMFRVAGKTGTAQIAQGGSYHNGTMKYLLSFAGYFPAEAPRYSCIVCIQKYGLPASGGGMSGVVFHNIAEGVMARMIKLSVDDARDSLSVFPPEVKRGDALAADYVLTNLNIAGGKAEKGEKTDEPLTAAPDVRGMGLRDAVYEMERRGLKVRVSGRGKVIRQSIIEGSPARRGQLCVLELE